jgi:hypothetical protein
VTRCFSAGFLDGPTIWGGPAVVRRVEVIEELARWCEERGITRPLVLGGRPISEIDLLLPLIHALEARGLSVRPCDRARSADTLAVGEAVAAYHLDECDGVIAIGGAVAMEVAKATVLMVGQRRPFVEFVEDQTADANTEAWLSVEESMIPNWVSVPTTPLAAAYSGGATILADDLSRACLVRHPRLRPELVIIDASLSAAIEDEHWWQSERAARHVLAECPTSGSELVAQIDCEGELDREDLLVSLAACGAGPIEANVGLLRGLSVAVAVRTGRRLSAAILAVSQETPGGLGALGVHEAEIEALVSAVSGADTDTLRSLLLAASPRPGGRPPVAVGRRRGGRQGRHQRDSGDDAAE